MSTVLPSSQPMLLHDFVNHLLQSSESLQVRNLHCQTSGSEVVLRGCVTSLDVKLLAHNLVRSACGMRQITDEIVVRADAAE